MARKISPRTGRVYQCARLVGVCRPYVGAAVAIVDDQDARHAVLSGRVPLLATVKHEETLVEHFTRATPEKLIAVALASDRRKSFFKIGPHGKETLAEHFARSTPEEIAAAVDTIGVGFVWDKMIAPRI